MADLQQLEDQIVGLSLLDAAALVKKLEERLGVSAAAAAPVAVAGGGAAAAAPAAVEEAKDLVDGAPKVLKENISKEDAEAIKKKFDGVATVEVK
jgi:large subunit ribosomal protein L7/L12